jgi:hypothetical protein
MILAATGTAQTVHVQATLGFNLLCSQQRKTWERFRREICVVEIPCRNSEANKVKYQLRIFAVRLTGSALATMLSFKKVPCLELITLRLYVSILHKSFDSSGPNHL